MKKTIEQYFREVEAVRDEMATLIMEEEHLTAEAIVSKSQELDELLLVYYKEELDTSA